MKDEHVGRRIDNEVTEGCRRCRKLRRKYRDAKVPDSLDSAFGDTAEPKATNNEGAVEGGRESNVTVSGNISDHSRTIVRVTFPPACQPQLLRR